MNLKILIYLAALFVLLLGVISMATATTYTVEVHDGIGAGSGDKQKQNEYVDPQQTNTSKEINNYASFSDSVDVGRNNHLLTTTDIAVIDDKLSVTDTAKIPINWTPIIIWSIIIGSLLILAWIGWYIYEIYFY